MTATSNEGVFVRVIDVGPGLCCVIKIPPFTAADTSPHWVIYDAGDGNAAVNKIEEIIPTGSTIDLMVLSHSDSDHIGAVPEICEEYTVAKVVRPGFSEMGGESEEKFAQGHLRTPA